MACVGYSSANVQASGGSGDCARGCRLSIEGPKCEVLGFGCGSHILLLLYMLRCGEFSCGVASARQSVLI